MNSDSMLAGVVDYLREDLRDNAYSELCRSADALERIATALERIANGVETKTNGDVFTWD